MIKIEKEFKMYDGQKVIARHWNEAAEGFDAQHDTEDLSLWRHELEGAIGLNGSGRTLDVGCGTGFLALMLAELGYYSTGLDFAEKMLDAGREKARLRELPVEFVQGTCEETPFQDDTFDAVLNCRVMWTLQDPVAALAEWKRILKPGGKVISFMRMMPLDGAGERYGEGIVLPLSSGKREDYTAAYAAAGLMDIQVVEMPEAMSHAEDMPGWTMFMGMKPYEE